MSSRPANDAVNSIWADDLLERRKYANFLTKTIRQRCDPLASSGARRPFTLAIDGDWGAGKTFFVNRWHDDLKAQEFAVVCFDAWKSDTTSEPLVALLSEINEQLEPLIRKLPVSEIASEAVSENWELVKKSGRKLAFSAAKIIASAALKHGAGLSIGDVFSTESTNDSQEASDEIADPLNESVEKIAEKLGEQLEKDHKARQHSIGAFRGHLGRTVALLEEHKVATIPLVVFVDELDRCRPDFAIKLLEVIKHLFDVPGVCFVVSINTRQLSESIRAVYGGGFDATHYLHRFFDLTYRLPEPNHYEYAKSLFTQWPFKVKDRSDDNFVFGSANGSDVQAYLFSLVSREFGLDLRAQRRVFDTALTAANAIPTESRIHSLFLFFLSALYVRKPSGWDEFWTRAATDDTFYLWYSANVRDNNLSHSIVDSGLQFGASVDDKTVSTLIHDYRFVTLMTQSEIMAKLNAPGFQDEARGKSWVFSTVMRSANLNGRPPTFRYKMLIELAGQVT